MARGVLREVSLVDGYTSPTPFEELAAGAGWDDIVSYFFTCIWCGQSFRLGAETYHGSGGSWELLSGLPADAL